MDDAYNTDAMGRTLRVRFDGDRRVTTREKVLGEINEIVDVKDLEAIYKCGDGPAWYLCFKTSDTVDRLGDKERYDGHDGMKIKVERIDRRKIKFRVHWFPLHMNLELVSQFMSRIGKNVVVRHEEQTYGALRLKTGAIAGEMVVSAKEYEDIPYKTMIYNRTVLITVLGRTVKCLKCDAYGHHGFTCPQNSRSGVTSYAGAARSRNEEDLENGPPARQTREGAREEEVTDTQPRSYAAVAAEEKNGPRARQAREGARKEDVMGPAQDRRARGQEANRDRGISPQDKRGRRDSEEESGQEGTGQQKKKKWEDPKQSVEVEMEEDFKPLQLPLIAPPNSEDDPVVCF